MANPVAVVSFRVQVRAFQKAVERFRCASAGTDASEAYAPLAEALSHAVTLDTRLTRDWRPHGGHGPDPFWFELDVVSGARTVPAIRWVRNAVQHQWVDALRFLPYNAGGRFPVRDHDWVWRPTDEVPGMRPGRRRKGERDLGAEGRKAYDLMMAGRPADFTLFRLAEMYSEVVSFFEPPTATNRAVVREVAPTRG